MSYTWTNNVGVPNTACRPQELADDLMHLKYDVADTWKPSTATSLKMCVIPTIPNRYIYECTTEGTTGSTEPTFPTTIDANVTDGTVVWTCRSKAGGSGGGIGFGNYISEPFSVIPGTGLEVLINPNRCVIDEVVCESTEQTSVSVTAKAAQLIYKKKDNTYDKLLPKMTASDLVDANTVGLWFPDGSASVPNAAVGVNGNTLAVANALTKSGTITAVDGWAGGDAAKGDGSTGYYTSANYTGFPVGNVPFEFHSLFTLDRIIASSQSIMILGALTAYQASGIYVGANGELYCLDWNTDPTTGFKLDTNQKYLFSFQYTGSADNIYVNGVLIYSRSFSSRNVAANYMKVLASPANLQHANATVDFVWLRNSANSTPAQIAALAQKLLIPCVYDDGIGTIVPQATFQGDPNSIYNGGNLWQPYAVGTFTSAWIQYVYAAGRAAFNYTIKGSGSYSPTAWTIKASNTGAFSGEEVTLDTKTGQTVTSDTVYPLVNTTAYKYYRLTVTATGGGTALQLTVFRLSLYGTSQKADIRDALANKAESQVVCFTRTDATKPVLIIAPNDPKGATPDWAYGIRVGPMGLGNKRKFLGWQYVSGVSQAVFFDSPFGTRKQRIHPVWAINASGDSETPCTHYSSALFIGMLSAPKIQVGTGAGVGWAYFNGAWQVSGYIGCYVEVLD